MSSFASHYRFSIAKNTSFSVVLNIVDSSDAVVDLTYLTTTMKMTRNRVGIQQIVSFDINSTVGLADPALGQVQVSLDSNSISLLDEGTWQYSVIIFDPIHPTYRIQVLEGTIDIEASPF